MEELIDNLKLVYPDAHISISFDINGYPDIPNRCEWQLYIRGDDEKVLNSFKTYVALRAYANDLIVDRATALVKAEEALCEVMK